MNSFVLLTFPLKYNGYLLLGSTNHRARDTFALSKFTIRRKTFRNRLNLSIACVCEEEYREENRGLFYSINLPRLALPRIVYRRQEKRMIGRKSFETSYSLKYRYATGSAVHANFPSGQTN